MYNLGYLTPWPASPTIAQSPALLPALNNLMACPARSSQLAIRNSQLATSQLADQLNSIINNHHALVRLSFLLVAENQ
jgi:hypothetical protein